MRDDGALAASILLSAHFRVGGRKHRMRDHPGIASRLPGEGTIASTDGLAAELLGFSAGIAREQSVLRLQFADSAGTPEPLRQHADDRGIDIADAVPEVAKFGNGIGRIHHYTFSFLSGFCDGVLDVGGKTW